MTRLKCKLVAVRLEIVLVSVQDRPMVCAKRTIDLDIIFNAPMVLLGDIGLVESCFGAFADSVSVSAR